MSSVYIKEGYKSKLSLYETQIAIGVIKRVFEDNLKSALGLHRVSAPLFVTPESGLNDNLNGIERPVEFDVLETKANVQVVQSLAKWKRLALKKYGFSAGEGIVTDMNAIRRDEEMDNLHSIYVDQWDWEKVITAEQRTEAFLESQISAIHGAIMAAHEYLQQQYPVLSAKMADKVFFITSQELEDMYPALSSKEREHAITREHGAVFIKQIGGALRSGERHDGRAPDYDDWTLNGDLLYWSDVLDRSVEIQSMGIRVNEQSMARQLEIANATDRAALPFHKALLSGELPLTVGGGIGESRLCMILLEKLHIGEVQVSVWDDATVSACEAGGVKLL